MREVLDWIRTNAEVLTLLVLTATLIAVIDYTRAAYLQAEGIQKPCVTLKHFPDTSDDAILEGATGSLMPQGRAVVLLQNVGSGPAINTRFQFYERREFPKGLDADAPFAPPIGSEEVWPTNFPVGLLREEHFFIAEYESLTGAKYRSWARIQDGSWVAEFRFEKCRPWRRRFPVS